MSQPKQSPVKSNVPELTADDIVIIRENFTAPDLIKRIWQLLDKTHKSDHIRKLAVFIGMCTAYQPKPKHRISMALKGLSSSGKDSLAETGLLHLPAEDSFKLTRGTASALEEESAKVRLIFFSEINKAREGANSELTEFFKQLSEGGVNVLKRDIQQNVINIKSQQKTLIYGTTETESDEELQTRYVVIPVESDEEKNGIVVDYYLDEASKLDSSEDTTESWLCKGIRVLRPFPVVIPFAKALSGSFDLSQDRIKRDVQRMLSLTRAVAWLHQKQRVIANGHIYAEPCDWLIVMELFEDFMTLTYNNLDHRHKNLLDLITREQGKHSGEITKAGFGVDRTDWAVSSIIREKSGLTRETYKRYIEYLINENYVERDFNPTVNRTVSLIKASGSQVGHRRLIGGSAKNFDLLKTTFDPRSDPPKNYIKKEFSKPDLSFLHENKKKNTDTFSQNDPPSADLGQNDQKVTLKKVKNYLQKQHKEPIHFDEIAKNSNVSSDELQPIIAKLLFEGYVEQPKPDYVQVLQ